MNTELFYYSIAEIGISIIIGVLLLFVTYKLIDRLVRRKYNIKLDNISFSIFSASILFSVAYLISGIKAPILNSLRMISDKPEYDGSIIIDGFKYTFLFSCQVRSLRYVPVFFAYFTLNYVVFYN